MTDRALPQDYSSRLADAVRLHRAGALGAASAAYAQLAVHFPMRSEPVRLGALLKLQIGDANEALQLGEKAVLMDPERALAWGSLARICRAAGRIVFAEAVAERALSRDPYCVEALLTLGAILLERGDQERALRHLRVAQACAPGEAETSFRLAEALARSDLLQEAISSYKQCISLASSQKDPLLADAHNNCGLLLLRSGNSGDAREHFNAAISVRRDYAAAYYNRGLSWAAENAGAAAIDDYRSALAIRPDYPQAWNNLGNLLLGQGQVAEAESAFRSALKAMPGFALAYSNLVSLFVQQKRLGEAHALLQEGLRQVQREQDLDYCRALVLWTSKRVTQAEPIVERLLGHEPGHVGGREIKAAILRERRAFRAAIELLEPIADASPGAAERWSNLGVMYLELKEEDKGIRCFERAIVLDPMLIGARNNLALAFRNQGRLEESEAALRASLELRPEIQTTCRLGSVLLAQGRADAARQLLEKAREQNPTVPEFYCNLGATYLDSGSVDQAEANLLRAIEISPDFVIAKWNLAFCYLLRGDFARGWPLYEMRLAPEMRAQLGPIPSLPPCPLWNGEALAGRRLLVVSEQGFGDQIQCLRFLPMLQEAGAQVTLFMPPALCDLARTVPGDVRVVSTLVMRETEAFDFHVFMMSLPGMLGVSADSIPSRVPYVRANSHTVATWRQRVDAPGVGLRVGLVWAGNPAHPNDRYRSIAPHQLSNLLRMDGVTWVAVDKGVSESLTIDGQTVHALGKECETFAQTAALVESLDVVISVDTAVAHLAGALGKPCWILLPANPDWRWQLERGDSPWYPSVRLFRQGTLGEWAPVVELVHNALAEFQQSMMAEEVA